MNPSGATVLPAELVAALDRMGSLVVLSGAGMSRESGVPVFRGPGGLWEGHRPEDLARPRAFARDPETVWRWYRWRLGVIEAAEPHAGHRALARLEREGALRCLTVITQNVDAMHQRAGSRNVLELHGNITRARCTRDCGARVPAATVDPEAPACACGSGRLRPDVVWYGESLDPRTLAEAEARLLDADMVWVVGTSSVVYPAAALPAIAAERGTCVVEINPEPTPLSATARFSLRMTASEGLAALVGEALPGDPGMSF